MGYSGSGSKVIDHTGKTTLKTQAGGATTNSGAVATKREVADQVTFHPDVITAIRDVKGNNSPLSWPVVGYERTDSAFLVVVAAGEGDENNVAELTNYLNDDSVSYCLIRKTEQIDSSLTAKFVYIRWIGNNIPRMLKAKLGTHAGDIYNAFAPCHTSLDTPDRHEVTDENIMKQIMIASGTYKHVLDRHPAPTTTTTTTQQHQQHQPQPRPTTSSGGRTTSTTKFEQKSETHGGAVKTIDKVVEYIDEEGIKQAIQEVRNDNSEIDWVLITYDAPQSKTLRLKASGTGGLDELRSNLTSEEVMYGLLRITEQIDDSVTVKFIHIDWRGENIHRMQRAKLATHSGAIRAFFHPFHVDVLATQDDELTDHVIHSKVNAASGTAVHVL